MTTQNQQTSNAKEINNYTASHILDHYSMDDTNQSRPEHRKCHWLVQDVIKSLDYTCNTLVLIYVDKKTQKNNSNLRTMDISDNSNSIQTKITTTCDALFIFEPFNLSGWPVLILMWVSIDVLYPVSWKVMSFCVAVYFTFFSSHWPNTHGIFSILSF